MTVIWRGTSPESQALADAVNRNCACEFGWGLRRTWCSGHRMLVEDQRALDGLLFARRIAGRLQHEEWMDSHEAAAAPISLDTKISAFRLGPTDSGFLQRS